MPSIKKQDIKNAISYIRKNSLIDQLNKIYSQVPKGDCIGCANCCMESVGASYIEFLNIYIYLQNNENIKRKVINNILDYYFLEYIKKNPCPFKDENNKCLIYDVRPLNCRIYGHWKKEDYEKNYDKIKKENISLGTYLSENYGINVNDTVLNYKIEYCDKFKPYKEYMTKQERLNFSDKIVILDSKLYSSGLVKFEFKDRGIVDYFIESIFYEKFARKIKINITKNSYLQERVIKKLKILLFRGE
ncbi:Putative zinc-or iron-chelating domain-containing protein [Alkalithermobacter thermoalcaliphilus JW-YL-7 = DSM 7308]|uniref:Zinc-or iron-chelating domain-containing protein n=1 Tax=Alkalithermobacter thermoalcaliphilus JW-YL-7 = DSM 7308 TaxID=1121328 RepID=A0A150FPN1_CLOPD|nr:protein of unknown function UPF0153 [[Clostridium] paradoxum JW-YL-7 = DSM 7308]SHK92278.1 Putative zinc-or iron-chelating domain-containing protein [[Clostridium] paradoxum JW-YL-7 = DSM 7308]